MDHLLESVKQHEGFRSKAYRDSVGVLTIGYGTNLEVLELTENEASYFLLKKLDEAAKSVAGWPWASRLNPARRDAVIEMVYNLGAEFGDGDGLKDWPKFVHQMEYGQFDQAADNMLSTKWSKQVGPRAARLAMQVRTGVYWQEQK